MPITPAEAVAKKMEVIPADVFEVVDSLIAANFVGRSATVEQSDILEALEAKGYSRDAIFDKSWLDFEPVYEAAGWTVEYDKPAYCESYEATFTFTPKAGTLVKG